MSTNWMSQKSARKRHRRYAGTDTLCRTAAASRRGPTGGLGAAALDRAASEARAAAADIIGLRPSIFRWADFQCTYVLIAYWEKRERGVVFSRPLRALRAA